MAKQSDGAIHIGQINLRIPGNQADGAHRVASGIADGLAQNIPAGMQRHLGALSVRVHVPAGATEAEINGAIISSIVSALSKGSSPQKGDRRR